MTRTSRFAYGSIRDYRLLITRRATTTAPTARRSPAAFLESAAASLQHRIRHVDSQLARLETLENHEILDLLRDEEKSAKQRAGEDGPGIEFASHGFRILVGRNARENDQLLRGACPRK